MTDKEKAKAFDEALERARKMLNMILDNEILGFPNQIREIFPQLWESEDERIRKEIVNFFKNFKETGTWKSISDVNTWIAYLEKQEERNPINHNLTTWHRDVVYCAMCNESLDEGLRCNLEMVYKTIKELVDRAPVIREQKSAGSQPVECIEFDNEFEKQVSHLLASVLNGEWKYDEGFVKHAAQSLLGYAKNEMKPDEWDKREKLFRKALQAANARIGQLFEENQKLKEQKSSWSEEDEKNLENIV